MAKLELKRIVSESEYRLRLLYALDQLGLCRQEELWPFLAELELMEYMPFCQYLSDLIESGEIGKLPYGNEYVTAKGRESLKLFAFRIPSSLRTKMKQKAPHYRKRLFEHKQVSAGYELSDKPGRGQAYGFFYEETVPILLMKMNTVRAGLCKKFVTGFSQKLPLILPLLNRVLPASNSDPVLSGDDMTLTEKGKPMIVEIGDHAFGAAVCLQDTETEYRLQLLFHSFALACCWAAGADRDGEELSRQMTTIFEASS